MTEEVQNPLSDIIMYKREDGTVNIEILVQDETLWLTQEADGTAFWRRQNGYHKALGKYI